MVLGGRRLHIRKQSLDDIAGQPQRELIHQLGAALLVLHSPQDEVVGVENARTIFDAARHPQSFVALDRADHLLMSDGPAGATERPPGSVVVTETGVGRFAQRISAGSRPAPGERNQRPSSVISPTVPARNRGPPRFS